MAGPHTFTPFGLWARLSEQSIGLLKPYACAYATLRSGSGCANTVTLPARRVTDVESRERRKIAAVKRFGPRWKRVMAAPANPLGELGR